MAGSVTNSVCVFSHFDSEQLYKGSTIIIPICKQGN